MVKTEFTKNPKVKNTKILMVAALLIIAVLTLLSGCDKEKDSTNDSDDGTSYTGAAHADVNSILNSITSGEMMYKFSYLDHEPDYDDTSKQDSTIAFNETWDRRLFVKEHGKNDKYYIYDPQTDGFETIMRRAADTEDFFIYDRYIPLQNGEYLARGSKFYREEFEKVRGTDKELDSELYIELGILRVNTLGEVINFYPMPENFPEYEAHHLMYLADADGYLYVYNSGKLHVYSPDIEYLFSLDKPENDMNPLFIMRDNDGNVCYVNTMGVTPTEDGVFCFHTIDIDNQCWTPVEECKTAPVIITRKDGESVKKLMFGGGLDYYFVDKYGIIGRNEGDTTTDLMLNWLDIGISYEEVAAISIYSPELIFVALHNIGGDGYRYGKIELVSTESVYGKGGKPTPLKIAVDKTNNPSASAILDYAASFTRSENGCPVEIVEYSDSGSRSANQQLLKDISAGNAPDMVVFGGGLSYEVLNKSGIFADLYKLGGKETDDLLPCVKKPFENDKGELNRLIFSFSLANVAGSKKNVKGSMTVDELKKLNSNLENGQYLTYVTGLTDITKQADKLFDKLIPNMLNDYIDYDKNTIDTSALGELLKLCKDAKVYGVEWIFVDPNLFRDGTITLDISEVYDPAQFLLNRYINFDKADLEYIGFPGFDSASVRPFNSLAVLKSSKNQAKAWQLLKHMLDCQAEKFSTCEEKELVNGKNAFPATYSGINALFDRLDSVQFLIDGSYYKSTNGKESYSININALKISEEIPKRADSIVYSDDDRAALLDIIENAKICYTTDAECIAIIEEEASYYFAGTKTLDEALKLIKNRIETRLAE